MAVYACDSEGIAELRKGQTSIEEAVQALKDKASSLKDEIQEYQTLGPHRTSIEGALDSIGEAIGNSAEPSKDAAALLGAVADKYQVIVDDDPFAELMGGGSGN